MSCMYLWHYCIKVKIVLWNWPLNSEKFVSSTSNKANKKGKFRKIETENCRKSKAL